MSFRLLRFILSVKESFHFFVFRYSTNLRKVLNPDENVDNEANRNAEEMKNQKISLISILLTIFCEFLFISVCIILIDLHTFFSCCVSLKCRSRFISIYHLSKVFAIEHFQFTYEMDNRYQHTFDYCNDCHCIYNGITTETKFNI